MAKKKLKLGKIIHSEPLNGSFDSIKEEARALIFDEGGRPDVFIHGDEILLDENGEMLRGKYILYRKSSEVDEIEMAYECKCGNKEAALVMFEEPYTIHCSACGALVFVHEKKKPRGAKKMK